MGDVISNGRSLSRDALLAIVLACVLGGAWAVQDWANLSALRLPDTDDAMRLQQVRDWLGGQAWSDLTQYRLGPPGGLAMHWSRLVDVPIAAIILALTPLVGAHHAELAAVVAWPLALFAAQLMLIAAIARRLGGDATAPTAMLVAALAYPAISIFMPGRIDHHGLQIVLLTACVHGMVAAPSKMRDMAIGAAMAASLYTGLELLPLVAVIGGWAVIEWLRRADGARMAGIGAGVGLVAILGGGLIPATSPTDLCDAVNPSLRIVMVAAGFAALLLGVFGARAPLPRWVLAGVAGITVAGLAMTLSPACLNGPYGAVDPTLKRLWLANVAEARPLFAASFATALGYVGLMLAGLIATLWRARRAGGAWWGMAALIAVACAITCLQLRGAYAGAALAAPALAAMIVAARSRGVLALAGAWIVSAGILYPIAGGLLARPATGGTASVSCTGPGALASLADLPAGRIVAPIDIGAFAIPATHHASLSAPYHRNNAANAAMYRFFLGSPGEAREIAARFALDYAVWCPGAFAEIDLDREAAPDALARTLSSGRAPAWMVPLSNRNPRVWRIDRRLPAAPPAP